MVNISANYGADKAALARLYFIGIGGHAFTVYYYLKPTRAASLGLPAAQSEIYPTISASDRENRRTIRSNGAHNDGPTRFTAVTRARSYYAALLTLAALTLSTKGVNDTTILSKYPCCASILPSSLTKI